MGTLNRRDFLKDSAVLAAALAGAGALRGAEPTEKKEKEKGGASEQLRVAVVGVHGQGMSHVGTPEGRREGEPGGSGYLDKRLNCVITHICDCDEAVIGSAMKRVESAQGKPPKYEKDIRKLVEDKTIDIISIAMPNHWHALAAIWAMQNGKDVYVEKPVCHEISEGRRMVEAARKYNKICQTGTQSRSSTGLREAMEFLHNGKLGKIKLSRGLCYKLRESIGKVSGPQEPPKTMDYDLWCGPAPNKPPMRYSKRNGTVHYDWHWFWDYGNGDIGNQGIHEMDKARWALNKNELPKSVVSIGGRLGYIDDGETPNTQICVFDYGDDCELIFEVRGLPTNKLKARAADKEGAGVGNIMYGTEGYMVMPSYSNATAFDLDGKVIKEFKGGESHFANFVKAVRSRKKEDLNADILEGHLSSALCHLGNISYRLGTEQAFNKAGKAFGDDKEAAETLLRMEDHLKENKVPLDDTKCRVGKSLKIDAKKEAFVDDKDANAMLTREYRKGFEVPAKV
jgi:predicted dehydrogenase